MSVSLGYDTVASMTPDRAQDLIAAAATMAVARPWMYTEPLWLGLEDDNRVGGSSKLFLDGTVEGEQPGVDESDYRFIANCLMRLAQEFDVEWLIDIGDGDRGRISPHGLDQRTEVLIKSLEDTEDLLRGGMDEFMKMVDEADDPMGDDSDLEGDN